MTRRLTVEQFALDRHAVVEASAGTGKTYTIENLVLRLLLQERVPLENILLVTFTEKATGDLKARLRSTLEKAVEGDPDVRPLLGPALDHFDQAPIFTIHGFCQRLLQEYALEQGQDFRATLVDDVDLYRTALREIQRKTWRATFGPHLRDVLECAKFNRDTCDGWEETVLALASKYKPRCGHTLRPPPAVDWWRRLEDFDTNWAGQLEIQTVQTLQQHLQEYKRQRGLQSFDDMIAQVEENLDPARNPDAPNLLAALRERFRYGIVDEFQDTDPLQWQIFRRIFLESDSSRLFVVGDPKQAIFGFRGADLPTYLKAAREMTEQFGAADYPLTTNWRSDPDLLEALNCLFLDGDWFPAATGIKVHHVDPPADDERQTRITADRTDRAALTVVDTRQWERLKQAQKNYAKFVAREIQRLLATDDGPTLEFAHKNRDPRAIRADDVCILIMKRPEAEPIIAALRQAGIPFSFYKQTGLWASAEAVQIEALLRALSRPEDRASFRKALLTCFFRCRPEELACSEELPLRHRARQLYQLWLAYAESRQWSALFGSMLEETGLLFEAATPPDADRRLANFRHLLGTLEQVGHGENRDLVGLLDWMRQRRLVRDVGEGDVQPVESGRPKVKLMTIHASKGLEFPVVFLAGGFTHMNRPGPLAAYRDDAGRLVFDLSPDARANDRVAADALAEQRRLFYVALTRPIFKLYVPQVTVTSRNRQWAGPVGTILRPALEQSCPDKLGPMVADVITLGPVAPALAPDPDAPEPAAAPVKPFDYRGSLFPTVDPYLGQRRIVVRSFSSMTRTHLSRLGEGASYGDARPVAADETAAVIEPDDPLRGAVFGDIVHNVLEQVDFAEVARAAAPDGLLRVGTPARRLLDREIKANILRLRTRTPLEALEAAALQQVSQLVWRTLHTPLAEAGGPLCHLAPEDRLHEVEFYYPEAQGEAMTADQRREEGFVTGFMDLVFRRAGKYYLVDYKTNLLPSYAPPALQRAMDEADYHRQYQLYLHALARWLKRAHGPKYNVLAHLGGVFYLFVRGLTGTDEAAGVYVRRPTKQDLDLSHALRR